MIIRIMAWPLALALLVHTTGCVTRPTPLRGPATTQVEIRRFGRIGVAFSEGTTTLGIVRPPLDKVASAKADALDGANLPWPSQGGSGGGGSGALLLFAFLLAISGIFAAVGGVAGAVSGFTTEEIVALDMLCAELHLQPDLAVLLAAQAPTRLPAGVELTGLPISANSSSPKTPANLSPDQQLIRSRLRDRGFDTLLVLRPVDCSLRPRFEKERGNGAQFLRIEVMGQFIRLHDWTLGLEVTATYEGKDWGYRGWILQNGAHLRREWEAALNHLAGEIAGWLVPPK